MRTLKWISVFVLLLFLAACASMGSGTRAEKQQAILAMKDDALDHLFRIKPDTRAQLQAAPGYAVFSNANINVIFVAAGTGYGVVKNNRTGKFTYMNMAEGGIGLGLGVKDYRIVIVFHSEKALNDFVTNGWTFGANADAAARATDKGASAEGEFYFGNMTVYTFTESGLALQATIKGTRFWADKALN